MIRLAASTGATVAILLAYVVLAIAFLLALLAALAAWGL